MKVVPLKVIVLFLFVICVVALKTEHGQHYARGGSKRNTKQRPLQHRHNIPSGTRTLGINEHIVDTSTSRASFSFSPSSSSSSSSPSTSSITPSSFVATESQVRHHHRQRAHIMKMEAIMADPSWSLKKALVDVLVRGGNLLLGKTMTDKLVRSRLEYGFRINGLDSVTTTKVRCTFLLPQ